MMHECKHTCPDGSTHIHARTRVDVCMHTCMEAYMRVQIYSYIHVHACVHSHACTYICTSVFMCTYMNVQMYSCPILQACLHRTPVNPKINFRNKGFFNHSLNSRAPRAVKGQGCEEDNNHCSSDPCICGWRA